MRDAEMAGTPRGLSPDLHLAQIPEDLDDGIWTWRPGQVRDANMAVPTGFSYPAMSSHVFLAACRPEEKAQENRTAVKGNTRGLFTFLRRAYGQEDSEPLRQLTYARLLDHLLSPEAIKQCRTPSCPGESERLLGESSQDSLNAKRSDRILMLSASFLRLGRTTE